MADLKIDLDDCDTALHALVRFEENQIDDGKPSLGIGMLLHVGGSIITGTLICEKEFFRRGNGLWKSMVGVSDAVASHLTSSTDLTFADIKPKLAQFIHLGGAQIWSSFKEMDQVVESPFLWRGRLNRVDAFMILDCPSSDSGTVIGVGVHNTD